MISQYITWRTARFPPAVGVGVLDDPFLRPPPAPRRRADCGRLKPPAKGEPPARVPPLTPSCASLAQGAFRALRRASMGSAPGPRPLFCKKAGQKTFKRQSTSDPSPSPLGRVIQSVREADTLAAEWHLPREWERRVGPETSRGRHHPISVFLWGSTPFLWARPKKWGGIGSTNLKSSRTKRRVPPTPNVRAEPEPRPYRRVVRLHNPLRRASMAAAPGPARFFVKSRPKNF